MAKKKISIGSWAYSIGPYAANPVPFDQVVSKLADLGFDGVELGGFPPHPNPDDCPDKDSRKRVRDMVANAGLEFSGLAANLWMHKLVSQSDNKALLAEFDKNVQFAKDLGIDVIRVDTLDPPTVFDTVDEKTGFDRVVTTFKECAKRAADAGQKICWEFEPGFAFNKPSQIVQIIDAVGMPNFGALYDTCHANMVAKMGARQPGKQETLPGGPLDLLKMLKGKITHLHLIDSDDTLHDNETSTHPPFGEGTLDFDSLFPAILESGIPDDWWCIDLCFWPEAWDATAKCKAYLDKARIKYGVA